MKFKNNYLNVCFLLFYYVQFVSSNTFCDNWLCSAILNQNIIGNLIVNLNEIENFKGIDKKENEISSDLGDKKDVTFIENADNKVIKDRTNVTEARNVIDAKDKTDFKDAANSNIENNNVLDNVLDKIDTALDNSKLALYTFDVNGNNSDGIDFLSLIYL